MTSRTVPSQETMRSALALACRAPSVHNSQPWRWKLAEHSVHLYLDRSRLLGVIDPTGREMAARSSATPALPSQLKGGEPGCTACRTRHNRTTWRRSSSPS
ncbi:hypothetical protein [Saccharopolyspora pogona]|uniref:hypothetical protein n=1 Tax=Saccharopolyspora pogona TaxID=333966 RepID=UPI0016836CC6|nr:hypothetical protein [Saccharopolyspora pogona]